MSNFISFFLLLSLTNHALISCYGEKVELECRRSESNNTKISRVYETCVISDTSTLIDENTELQVVAGQSYGGFSVYRGNVPLLNERFLSKIRTLFPVLEAMTFYSCNTHIDDHAFRGASELLGLSIIHSTLPEIGEFMFTGADNLIALNLNQNRIKRISPKAFKSVPKLEILELQLNEISILDKETFEPLKNLKELDLINNKLTFIEPELFAHNSNLEALAIGDNPLKELEIELSTTKMVVLGIFGPSGLSKLAMRKTPETSNIITNIEEIHFTHSNFTTFADINIDDHFHIKKIYLGYNNLSSLNDASDFIRHVSELDISINQIEDISPTFFEKCENLEWLAMGNYEPEYVLPMKERMFEPLKKLKTLYVRHHELRPEWFQGLTQLENLHFFSDTMSTFDYIGLVDALPGLKTLEISAYKMKDDFIDKMVEDLKAVNKFYLIEEFYKRVERDRNW